MNVLVTGGSGYIGSHTCVLLLEAGYNVIVLDNYVNSNHETLRHVEMLSNRRVVSYEVDVTNAKEIDSIFSSHMIDGVIHFAGHKAVGESVQKPLDYYINNLTSTMALLKACEKYGVSRFIFSSSATVYGVNDIPFKETISLSPATNPYGETKVMCEKILQDVSASNPDLAIGILRYFNPVGSHESGVIGENPKGIPNNIMPYITKVAKQELNTLKVFGNDYPTTDGTGVRDYIHVMDLAEGHLAAFQNIETGYHVYNLGTGKGTSVLELIQAFEQANGVKVPYEIAERRPGDIAVAYADVSKAEQQLNWKAKRNIEDMCRDAWNYELAGQRDR
ncbi:UDP-glucose 4-epimerase [Pontibacillus halophilus JSM 076056 = DSM 19796]|uniref:UDP-glucose 4-epimerase n=1 Tax=Pontibacillus halophilus JSM 076056 = DSM 19796 TaxID=1385510 RepID=A0A0A5GM65_9BACI|nr:UDP-glucose 4-epimerase GalE [Pontibacillus halophilus]KGX92260.1 UDP-glucose 4-epimerase [Pontibacillus halophilus JSM 076056 = DSM 19796]